MYQLLVNRQHMAKKATAASKYDRFHNTEERGI